MGDHYTLYHNYYSVCSIMVRYTLAISGPPKEASSQIVVKEQIVDIFHEEQLTEQFLCEVNAEGQVPVLLSPALEKPIADSLEITHFLADRYPSLIPARHREQITRLLKDLHALNYFSLSFPSMPQIAQGFKASVLKRLSQEMDPVSEKYRKALEYKLTVVETNKIGGLKPENVLVNAKKAKDLLAQLELLLPPEPVTGATATETSDGARGPWLFGLTQPTALDAHLITFIARLRDVGRGEALVPEKLGRYADMAMATKEWVHMMEGRITMTRVSQT